MTPLQITIRLASPLAVPMERPGPVGVFPVMLDSLLMDLAARSAGMPSPADRDPSAFAWSDIPIPLDVAEFPDGNGGVFRCHRASAGVLLGPRKVVTDHLIRRWRSRMDDWVDLQSPNAYGLLSSGKRTKGSGAFRDWKVPVLAVAVRAVRFWAVGDAGAVADLLYGLNNGGHLGFRRAAGYGFVERVEVIRVRQDHSIVGPDGRLARPLPAAAALWAQSNLGVRLDGCPRMFARPVPPYWLTSGRSFLYLPPTSWWFPTEDLGGDDGWLLKG